MRCVRTGNGEVAVVHLIDHQVGGRLTDGVLVLVPALRIGIAQCHDGATLAIDAHSLGKDAGTLAASHVEGIEAAHEVALYRSRPDIALTLHLDGLQRLAAQSLAIDTHLDTLGISRGKQAENGLLWGVADLVEAEVLGVGERCHHDK